jgi:hypothetical protein
VVAHAIVFPYVDTISWIIRHVDLKTLYILNAKGNPIVLFRVSNISQYYHFERGILALYDELIKKFPHKAKDLFKI